MIALVATRLRVADTLGRWLQGVDPFAANSALTVLVAPGLAWAVVAHRRQRRAAGAQRELSRLSRHDPLTGLANRAALAAVMQRCLRAADHSTIHVAALFCDLDRFKLVNDTYGHEIGDRVMVAVARRLQETIGSAGTTVRYGGDEFIVVHAVSGRAEAERVAQRLVDALEEPFEVGTDTIRISVSVGVALSTTCTVGAEDLVRDADVAMYQAKRSGPGAVCVYDETMRGRLSPSTAEARLRWAIDHHEIQLLYEPVMTVRDGTLAAVRARLHWDDPHRGPVPAREFIPMLEDTGLILEVGMWALGQACNDARRWRELAPDKAVQVVVPITARQLAQSNFRDLVAAVLTHTGVERTQLCLALADALLVNDITDAWTMLRHARTLGVQVALDSFGAEGSTIADLRRVRLDQIWLDNSLVAGLDANSDDAVIVEHLIELAHSLNLISVASDVENAMQLTILRRLGCDRAHGPFLGLSLTRDEIDVLVAPPVQSPPSVERAGDPFASGSLPRLRDYSSAPLTDSKA